MQAEAVLITRPEFDPQIHVLGTAAATCLGHLLNGKSLGVAMADADPTLDLGALLGLLLQQGAITKLN